MVGAFPAEIQNAVAAQLADSLVAVVAQRVRFRTDLNIRLPECEILLPTIPIKTFIRNREFFKISQVMETGAEAGMWTFSRYQNWMSKRTSWHLPNPADEAPDSEPAAPSAPDASNVEKSRSVRPSTVTPPPPAPAAPSNPARPIEIEPVEGGLGAVLRKLGS